MPALQEAISCADSRELEKAADALKGLVGELYAKPAFEAAHRLEEMGRSGDLAVVEEAYASFQKEIERLIEALIRFLDEEPTEGLTKATADVDTKPTDSSVPVPVVDTAELVESLGGDVEFAREVVGLFLEQDYPKLWPELEAAVSSRDSEALEKAAHALKGLVGELCAKPAFESALRLEMMGRNGDLSGLAEEYPIFSREIEQVRQALIEFWNAETG